MSHLARQHGSLAGGLAVIAALLCGWLAAEASAATRYVPLRGVDLPQHRLFDLGATDFDRDGRLDVFTTNHKFHPVLLRNQGDGTFTDLTGPAGLAPTPEFPGLEFLRAPQVNREGVYVYITDSDVEKLPGVIHIRVFGGDTSGRIIFEGEPIAVKETVRATTKSDRDERGRTILDFTVKDGGHLSIMEKPIDFPISVRVDPPPDAIPLPLPPILPEEPELPVFVGTGAIEATTDQFILTLRDRHGYAFADVGGGPGSDVFAVSGGLGGSIALPGYVGRVQDELIVDGFGRHVQAAAGSGLDKGNCRGRAAAAVDADADGLLDLFESCEGQRPQLFRQLERGRFGRLDSPKAIASAFRWVQLGKPSERPELLAATSKGVRVFQLSDRGWRVKQTVRGAARKGKVAQFATADIDTDGDLDVLAVAPSGNTLLRNDRGRLRRAPLARSGLPEQSVAASFVDFDNDGTLDLHLVPQGILAGKGGGRFRETGDLAMAKQGAAVTSWPDLNADGTREAIIATSNAVFSKNKRVQVLQRRGGTGGHWLEVDLIGPAGNREAVGARISIGRGAAERVQWVGQNDTSHFSQGHYRAYFGLGKRLGVSRLLVEWPDGRRTVIPGVEADRLVRLAHPDAG